MYFQSRLHQEIPVADAAAAVRLIQQRTIGTYQCPTWKNSAGQRIALVDDSHIDNAFLEVAVVNLDTRRQLESITFGWVDTEAEKLAMVLGCQDDDASAGTDCILPLSEADLDVTATFTCSCCGEPFQSTLRQQIPYDQDAGFGHCPGCLDYIAGRAR